MGAKSVSVFRNGVKYKDRYLVEKVVPFFEGELAIAKYDGKRYYLQSAKLQRPASPRVIQQYLMLDHPLVIPYDEVYPDGKYIVTIRPYFAIQPLPQYVASKGLDEDQFIHWASQLLDLDQQLQNYSLPMYLLKDPRNIGISSEGKLKVIFCGVEQVTTYEPSVDWGTFFISLLKGRIPSGNVKSVIPELHVSSALEKFLEKAIDVQKAEVIRPFIEDFQSNDSQLSKPTSSTFVENRQSLKEKASARPSFVLPKEKSTPSKLDYEKTIIRRGPELPKAEEKKLKVEKPIAKEKKAEEKPPLTPFVPDEKELDEISQKTEFRLPLQAFKEELERREQERVEQLRKQLEQQEQDLLETYKQEFEKRRQELLDRQRKELERQEAEFLKQQQREFEQQHKERLKNALIKREQMEWEKRLKKRLEEEKKAYEKRKQELLERLAKEFEQREKELLEMQRQEFERRKKERLEMQQRELQRLFNSLELDKKLEESQLDLDQTKQFTPRFEEESLPSMEDLEATSVALEKEMEEKEINVSQSHLDHEHEENVEEHLDKVDYPVEEYPHIEEEMEEENYSEEEEKPVAEPTKRYSKLDYETVQQINDMHTRLARQFEEYKNFLLSNQSQ
jgi:hypothetical protein